MADDSFVQFLRRKEVDYPQSLALDAIHAHAGVIQGLEAMCSDPAADLKAPVETLEETTSLEAVRQESRSLAKSLPILMSGAPFFEDQNGTPLSDHQAEDLINSLIANSQHLHDVADLYPNLEGAENVARVSRGLIQSSTALKGLLDSHAAGIEEGLKRGRASRTGSRSSEPKLPCSHTGRIGR